MPYPFDRRLANPRTVPMGPVRVNWAHPLAQGLLRFHLPCFGRDISLKGPSWSPGSGGPPVIGGSGVGPASYWPTQTNVDQGFAVGNGGLVGGLSQFSVVALIKTTTATPPQNGCVIYCERGSTGNDIFKMGQSDTVFAGDPNNFGLVYRNDGGNLAQWSGATYVINDGAPHVVAMVYNGTEFISYVDGKLDGTLAWSNGTAFTNAGVVQSIGYDIADNTVGWAGHVAAVMAYDVALSAAAAARIAATPFAMLEDARPITFWDVAASAPPVSSPTGPGVFPVFGNIGPAIPLPLAGLGWMVKRRETLRRLRRAGARP